MSRLIDGLVEIDARVLGAVERVVRKLQILTGKTSFFFADLCLAVICSLIIARNILSGFDFILSCFLVLILIRLLFSPIIERKEINRLHNGLANPEKVNARDIAVRLFNLLASIFSVSDLIGSNNLDIRILSLMIVLLAAYFYLSACDPLPPCQSKIKEWVKGLFFLGKEITLITK